MTMARAVEWVLMDKTAHTAVHVGDKVSVDAGGMPIYEVVALDGGRALLTDERRTAVRHMPLDLFRWVGRAG